MTMYNRIKKQNENFTMNSMSDETFESDFFDRFIKVEDIEEPKESSPPLHTIMIKDEIIDDIEYESKHLLVQTLFNKDYTISQQNENNSHTINRLSECLKEEENEDLDNEQDYLEGIVKNEYFEENEFQFNDFTIKPDPLSTQNEFCTNVDDKKLFSENLNTSEIRLTTSNLDKQSIAFNVCEKKFSNKKQMPQHVLIDTVKNPFVCDVCQVRFPQKFQLKIHVLTHSWQKPYRCNMCNQSFISLNAANKHHAIVHTEGKPFQCKICQTSFGTILNLKHHMSIHFDEDFICKFCNKKFICKSHLNSHIAVLHSNRLKKQFKPYKCNICDQSFLTKRDLVHHYRMHAGETLYKCPICCKYLKLKSLLISHMKIHSSRKLYACLFCNKTYKLRSFMVRHAKTHHKSY